MTIERLDELMRAVFEELLRRGGRARGSDVLAAVRDQIKLTPVELEVKPNGAVRWEANVRFHTVDCARAGWLHKSNGDWEVTPEGQQALTLPAGQFIRKAAKLYREWHRSTRVIEVAASPVEEPDIIEAPTDIVVRAADFDKAQEQAREAIEEHIFKLGPYEFQDLVGHLMQGMGYFVAHTAPRGPDGGIDLIVYKDPLGTVAPRIKVQVKHRRENKVSSREVRELQGLIQHDEVGLIVSSGGFAREAENEARRAAKHVDLIGLERFITLWQEHYVKLSENGRAMLPLIAIYHLAPAED